MADVRKLLRAERAARSKPALSSAPPPSTAQKRPLTADSTTSTDTTKRQRTKKDDSVSNPSNLPTGFFDEDTKRPTGDIVVGGVQKGPKQKDTPAGAEEKKKEGALPADFFGGSGATETAVEGEVDEDEWAAFEAEVVNAPLGEGGEEEDEEPKDYSGAIISAAPVLNRDNEGERTVEDAQNEEVKSEVGDIDDAREKLLEEFEEMESLEQRVLALKEKREQLRHIATTVTPMETDPPADKMEEDGSGDEEDSDEDDDEDDWMRSRGA